MAVVEGTGAKSRMIEPGKIPWSKIFYHSRLSPFVFGVGWDYLDEVFGLLRRLDLLSWSRLARSEPLCVITPLLDGLFI